MCESTLEHLTEQNEILCSLLPGTCLIEACTSDALNDYPAYHP